MTASTTPVICTHCGTVLNRKRVTAATPPGSGEWTMIESGGGAACDGVVC